MHARNEGPGGCVPWEEHEGLQEALRQQNVREAELEAALRGVANAYGCFAGCTGALAGAPPDGSGHAVACSQARAALKGDEAK